jgi:glucose-1-phosphate cytidylyltransferase
MKILILAGGFGSRLSEETEIKPKPMVQIGDKPILWHLMKIYSYHGINDFVVLLGYKGYMIKEYFVNYFLHQSNVTINLANNSIEIHQTYAEPWVVTLVDTGLNTMTGGRIKRVKDFVGNETFMLTYGDGLGDINIRNLLKFHEKHGKAATITAVQPLGRFGALEIGEDGSVCEFREKPKGDGNWINGGFFVLEPSVFDYLEGDSTIFEQEPLERLSRDGELMAFPHLGFWQPMDTLRDKRFLEELWNSGRAPWRLW